MGLGRKTAIAATAMVLVLSGCTGGDDWKQPSPREGSTSTSGSTPDATKTTLPPATIKGAKSLTLMQGEVVAQTPDVFVTATDPPAGSRTSGYSSLSGYSSTSGERIWSEPATIANIPTVGKGPARVKSCNRVYWLGGSMVLKCTTRHGDRPGEIEAVAAIDPATGKPSGDAFLTMPTMYSHHSDGADFATFSAYEDPTELLKNRGTPRNLVYFGSGKKPKLIKNWGSTVAPSHKAALTSNDPLTLRPAADESSVVSSQVSQTLMVRTALDPVENVLRVTLHSVPNLRKVADLPIVAARSFHPCSPDGKYACSGRLLLDLKNKKVIAVAQANVISGVDIRGIVLATGAADGMEPFFLTDVANAKPKFLRRAAVPGPRWNSGFDLIGTDKIAQTLTNSGGRQTLLMSRP